LRPLTSGAFIVPTLKVKREVGAFDVIPNKANTAPATVNEQGSFDSSINLLNDLHHATVSQHGKAQIWD